MLKLIKNFTNNTFLPNYELKRSISTYSGEVFGKVLDFGCGSKPYKHLFDGCDSYIGLDTQNSGHNHQKSKVDVYFDGVKIPFPDDTFDAVVSFQVLEHLADSKFMLSEIHRVLKKSGRLLITAPLIWPEHEVPFDFNRWTSYGLSNLLVESGFTIADQGKIGSPYTVIASLILDSAGSGGSLLGKLFSRVVAFILNLLGLIVLYCGAGKSMDRKLYLDNIVLAKK